jgi:anti-sigma factor (TIGR02949 family)
MKHNEKPKTIKDIDCDEAIKRLMDYLDNYLNDHRIGELKKHFASCRSCMDRYEFQKSLKTKIGSLSNQTDGSLAISLKKLLGSL